MNDASGPRLHRYFVIRQSGVPSSSIDLDFAGSTSRNPTEHPEWLIRHCEVGDAIFSLPPSEREAVERRWYVAVHIEECVRAIRVASMHETVCRRQQTDASQWKSVLADAEAERQAALNELHRLETKQYRRGMDKLEGVLGWVE